MKALFNTIDDRLVPFWDFIGRAGCGATLAARLYMANIFWKSGVLKLDAAINGRFDEIVTAFTYYHPIPGLPPELAAILGTGGEIALPIMLALGLLGRIGALGLLIMTLVIEFAVPADYGISHPQHYWWMIMLAVPLFHGMGRASVDYWLVKWLRKS